MTTDDKTLTEQIARALRAHDAITHGWGGTMRLTVEVRDYLPAAAAVLPIIRKAERDAAREALDGLEADTAQVIRTMRERGEQGWARYAIANDILDDHRTRFYPEEARA